MSPRGGMPPNIMNKKAILTIAVAALMQGATATVRYASPTGTDANGTSADAPGKLTTMINKLVAGDELYLLDGQYDFTSTVSINRKGNADSYILIAAYPGTKPILDFRNAPLATNAVKVGGNYLHLRGLTVRYSGYKGIWVEGGKYNILENIEVYGCCNAGIQLRSGGHNMVVNCDAHDNFDYQDNGGNADGFADKQGNACAGNIYIGCRAWNNSDDGWDSYQRVTDGTPTVYINCIAYGNGPATFDMTDHPRANGIDADFFEGKDLAKYANGGNPNGFKLGGKGTAHNTELYRCLSVGHRSKGFDQNNNAGEMTIVNCTAYKNKINYGFGNDYAYTLSIHNCVSLSPTGGSGQNNHLATAKSGTVVQGNNTWLSGFATSEADFESLDASLILEPRNADGSLPETLLLHLKSSAANLIDKGVEFSDFTGEEIGGYVFHHGAAPDLGCYETSAADAILMVEQCEAADQLPAGAPRFDLQGRRVDAAYKGVVVCAGRRYLQR